MTVYYDFGELYAQKGYAHRYISQPSITLIGDISYFNEADRILNVDNDGKMQWRKNRYLVESPYNVDVNPDDAVTILLSAVSV